MKDARFAKGYIVKTACPPLSYLDKKIQKFNARNAYLSNKMDKMKMIIEVEN
jgi:hypothetical protein